MSTANATARRRLPRLPLFALVTGVFLLRLSSPVFADGGGGCGPQASRGTGCQPTTNPAPLTLAFSMPGRNDAVAVTLTLTRGLQQDRSGPSGSPSDVQVRTWETDSQNPRPPTLEEQGYILASEARRQDGSLLVFENPEIPEWTPGQTILILVRPGQPPAPTGRIRNWRTTRVYALFEARQAAVNAIASIGLPRLQVQANPAAGLTNLPNWFWMSVEQGQLDPARELSVPIPWETTWQEEVDVCQAGTVPGSNPAVINPCQSRRTEWQDRRDSGVITANIAVQLQATNVIWWFGDTQLESYAREGLGAASYDINSPSPVRHTYLVSSLQNVDQGGYEVRAFVAWQATYVLSLSNGQSETFTIPGARSNVFTARHQVRESQAVVAQTRGN
jgi:hypothetical protein